jgi:hypothetical protein
MISLLGVAGISRAEVSISPEEEKDGFHLLFNGKDLTGFVEVQGRPGAFTVVDGVLCGTREGLKAYWLSTDKKYSDFELRLEYMLTPGGNSGIFIRVPHHRPRTSVVGMEIQLLDDGAKTGTPTSKDTGAIYRVQGAKKFVSKPAGEWNQLTLRCQGDRIQVTLNGELINDFDMTSSLETKNRPREGYIGLSAHTDVVKFRHVRIKELTTQ